MRIGIFGYGNLGRGVERALVRTSSESLFGIFTKRKTQLGRSLSGAPLFDAGDVLRFTGEIDVMINCGSSKSEVPRTTPFLASHFHVVDAFDTHRDVRQHFAKTDAAAKRSGHLALICAGWDPGLFSVARLYEKAFLHGASPVTLWGPGVSQGHSDALRRIPGVLDAVAFTYPREDAEAIISKLPDAERTPERLHRRVCLIAKAEGADAAAIEAQVRAMPGYFAGYETEIRFTDLQTLHEKHGGMPHGGHVISKNPDGESLSFSLKLPSNPDFTGFSLTVFAHALFRLAASGRVGAILPPDIPPTLFLERPEELWNYI